MVAVKPEILIWARETAGLSIDEAAAKLNIKEAHGVSASDRLGALESGNGVMTRPLVLKMAKVYRRPLLAFYLDVPPQKGDRGEDFRNLPQRHTEFEPLVDALVRDIRARQSMIRAVLEDDEDAEPIQFIGSMTMEDGVGKVLASIRQTIGIDISAFRAQGLPEAAFALFRAKVEAAGVFVILAGNLGSHHTALDVSAFRGFALADPIAPFIVIDDQDAKPAWSFTLLHELTHLWLGATGISGTLADNQLERFCNDVASNILLSDNELGTVDVDRSTRLDTAARLIGDFAEGRLLSRSLVAYRLFRAGRISEKAWRELTSRFQTEWYQARAARRERARDQDGGPNYYLVRRHRLGLALLRFVARNMSGGAFTPTKAGKVLGVKPRNVEQLLSGAALSSG